jgi:high-affinity Fe2+/Pb2+ permease
MIAVYTLLVSLGYFGLHLLSPGTAEGLTILFVAALLVPAGWYEVRRRRRDRP